MLSLPQVAVSSLIKISDVVLREEAEPSTLTLALYRIVLHRAVSTRRFAPIVVTPGRVLVIGRESLRLAGELGWTLVPATILLCDLPAAKDWLHKLTTAPFDAATLRRATCLQRRYAAKFVGTVKPSPDQGA